MRDPKSRQEILHRGSGCSRTKERRSVDLILVYPRQDLFVRGDETHAIFLYGSITGAKEDRVRPIRAVGD